MRRRLIMVAIGLSASFGLVSASAAQNEPQPKSKGIYESLPLNQKDYHLIETSDEMHAQFVRRGMLYGDDELDAWLQSIGDRLAPDPTDFYQEYRFFLLRDPSANAFALPNGRIYVHTGLVSRLENEAQLASLLAHEINHVAGHHSVLAFRSQRKKAIAGIFVGVAGAVAGGWGDVAGLMINAGIATSIFGYSRELEQEADINGYERVLAAGYDIREMPKLYEVLGQDYEGLQPRISGKWTTHPDLASRGQYMQERISGTPAGVLDVLALGADEYRHRIRPLALASVEDYIADDFARSALELARKLVGEDPDHPANWIALGDSWAALGYESEYVAEIEPATNKERRKQNKAKRKAARDRRMMTREEWEAKAAASPDAQANLEKNLAESEKAFLAAIRMDEQASRAHKGLGDVHKRRGNYRKAGLSYTKYLKLSPNAPDRSIIMADLKEFARKIKQEQGNN